MLMNDVTIKKVFKVGQSYDKNLTLTHFKAIKLLLKAYS